MFYSLTGTVIATDASSVALECGGVGFRCSASLNTLKRIGAVGEKLTLYTYLSVREDALDLFGFYDLQELDCYKMLISVSGIGPKAALAVLSELTPERLAAAVSTGDVKSITRAQGVGPKTAERVILELKGKLSFISDSGDTADSLAPIGDSGDGSKINEALSGLQFLGYNRYEASKALGSLDPSLSVEEMIRKAMGLLSGNL